MTNNRLEVFAFRAIISCRGETQPFHRVAEAISYTLRAADAALTMTHRGIPSVRVACRKDVYPMSCIRSEVRSRLRVLLSLIRMLQIQNLMELQPAIFSYSTLHGAIGPHQASKAFLRN